MSEQRRFLSSVALAALTAELGRSRPASAREAKRLQLRTSEPKPKAAFDIQQIKAGVLSIGYADLGPKRGPAVILLHGFPYDIHSYVDVAPLLAARGYRVILLHLRGHGSTRFLSNETFRNGEQSATAVDIIALMDALRIEHAILAGSDWGARTANIVAALWPKRCKAMVSMNGYLIKHLEPNKLPLSPWAEWVSVLLCDGTQTPRPRRQPARPGQDHLAVQLTQMELRPRHLRANGSVVRRPGLREHRDSRLPLAAEPGVGRAALPAARKATR
jgi:pimeloyl-ACP methyl ester carboxylesterase